MKLSTTSQTAAAAAVRRRSPAARVNTQSGTGQTRQRRCACGASSCAGCQDGAAIERARASSAASASTRTGVTSRDGEVETETESGAAQGGTAAPPAAHCAPSGVFTSIPTGTLSAKMSGGRLQAPFIMRATFDAPIPCTCAAGEYRQQVRGKFTANGTPVTHELGPGRPMSDTTFQEDGDVGAGTVYGHRAIAGTKSRFLPNQADGCKFEGEDEPGISAASGTIVTMHLDFIGTLIDTTDPSRTLATRSWSVAGSATMP